MAAGLRRLLPFIGAHPQRRFAFVLLVVAVLILHGWVTQHIAERLIDLDKDAAMPARIEVAYVREMALAAPPPVAAPVAPPAPARPRARAPRKVAKPTPSASAAQAAASAASVPVVETKLPGDAPPDLQPPAPANTPEGTPRNAPESTMTAESSPPTSSEAASVPGPAVAAAPASSSASGAAPFEWPVSTRMSYLLTGNVRGPVEGSAQVEWIRVGERYQVHLDLVVGPKFAPVATRRMSSDGDITDQGLMPRRYDQQTRAFGTDRGRATILFEPDAVVLANGERKPTVPGVQDTASQFVQLTYVFSTQPDLLRIGGSVDIPLALPHKVDVWTYDVVDEELLYTNFGPLPSIHLKPRRAPNPGSLTAEIWFAPQLRYLPVRILVRQSEETFLDMLIQKKPEMGTQ